MERIPVGLCPRGCLTLLMAGSVQLIACSNLEYLAQATAGQIDLMARAEPISQLVKDEERVPPCVRRLLAEVDRIKAFAGAQGLVAAESYDSYVELDREAVVWVVTACKPLEFTPKRWSFPFFGSFPYLGWFSGDDAQEFAEALREQGWDVYVRGAAAYSTLGWFPDPVLSTMFVGSAHPVADLAGTVLHESLHATIHLADQTYFNEGLATFAQGVLTQSYLRDKYGEESKMLRAYLGRQARRRSRRRVLINAYERLDALYASTKGREEKLRMKATILTEAAERIGARQPLNNAALTGLQLYHAATAAFSELFAACGKHWPAFLSAALTVQESDFETTHARDLKHLMAKLAARRCE